MTTPAGRVLIFGFTALVALLAKPFGQWLHAIYEGRRTLLHTVLGPLESGFYRLSGVDPKREQGWRACASETGCARCCFLP